VSGSSPAGANQEEPTMADQETKPDEQKGLDDAEGHRFYQTLEEGVEERMRTSAHGSAQDDTREHATATDTPDEDKEAGMKAG
jgi:hypothetical protein